MSLGAQAEVVENILLHGIQVGVFHLDLFSKSNLVQQLKHEQKAEVSPTCVLTIHAQDDDD